MIFKVNSMNRIDKKNNIKFLQTYLNSTECIINIITTYQEDNTIRNLIMTCGYNIYFQFKKYLLRTL